jgi:predicted HTH domain antitoxin
MNIVISDDLVNSSQISETEFKQEIAIMLYNKGKITLKKAADFVRMDIISFQHLLASQGIDLNYDVNDFEEDIKTLKKLGRI